MIAALRGTRASRRSRERRSAIAAIVGLRREAARKISAMVRRTAETATARFRGDTAGGSAKTRRMTSSPATLRRVIRARVTFVREPKEMPYGIEALMRDDAGNFYSLTQRR